jgi:hypothetical protein
VTRRRRTWREAFAQVAGDEAVLTGAGTADQLRRKGYRPVVAPEGLVNAAERYGLQAPAKVLSADELSAREITEATADAQAAVDLVWELLEGVGLASGKEKPPVRCFTSILYGGAMRNGYCREREVFINSDLAGSASLVGGRQALPHRLVKVAPEECAHHVTGATDNSRDFQDFLLDLAVRPRRSRVACEVSIIS